MIRKLFWWSAVCFATVVEVGAVVPGAASAVLVEVPSVGPPCNSPVVDTGVDVTVGDRIVIAARGTISLQAAEHSPPDPMAIVNNASGVALLDSTGWNFGCNGFFPLIAEGQPNPSLASIFAAGGCTCGDDPVPSLTAPLGALLWGKFVDGQSRLDEAASVFPPTAGPVVEPGELVMPFSGRLGLQINDHYAPNNSGSVFADLHLAGAETPTEAVPATPTPTATATEIAPTDTPTAATAPTDTEIVPPSPTPSPIAMRIERVVLRRGRATGDRSEARFSLRAAVSDQRGNGGNLAEAVVAGTFELEVADADASFDVVLPLSGCSMARNRGAVCRTDAHGPVRIVLAPTALKGVWLLRADTSGLDPETPEVRVGPGALDAPVSVTLRGGSTDWRDAIDSCREAGPNALACQRGRTRP